MELTKGLKIINEYNYNITVTDLIEKELDCIYLTDTTLVEFLEMNFDKVRGKNQYDKDRLIFLACYNIDFTKYNSEDITGMLEGRYDLFDYGEGGAYMAIKHNFIQLITEKERGERENNIFELKESYNQFKKGVEIELVELVDEDMVVFNVLSNGKKIENILPMVLFYQLVKKDKGE